MRRPRFVLLLLMTTAVAGCDTAPERSPATTLTVVQGQPIAPEEPFRFVADAEASSLLEQLAKNPRDAAARTKIVAHYRQAGYRGMAEFEESAGAIAAKCEAPVSLPRFQRKGWSCGPDPDSDSAAVKELWSKAAAGDLRAALAVGERAIQNPDVSCAMIVEYAQVILTADTQRIEVAAPLFETAMRVAVTADLESMMRPEQTPQEWTYRLLAAALLRRGDAPAAEVAARLALRHWEEEPVHSEPMAPAVHKQMEDLRDLAHRAACTASR